MHLHYPDLRTVSQTTKGTVILTSTEAPQDTTTLSPVLSTKNKTRNVNKEVTLEGELTSFQAVIQQGTDSLCFCRICKWVGTLEFSEFACPCGVHHGGPGDCFDGRPRITWTQNPVPKPPGP